MTTTHEHIERMRSELDAIELHSDAYEAYPSESTTQPPGGRLFSRSDIGLRDVDGVHAPLNMGAVVHISGGKPHPQMQVLRTMQHYHMDIRGWSDIRYNWAFCNLGHVYTLRGGFVQGAHAKGKNRTHVGIVWLGGHPRYADVGPSQSAFEALDWLLRREALPEVLGHREFSSKSCPGDEIFAWLSEWRKTHEK